MGMTQSWGGSWSAEGWTVRLWAPEALRVDLILAGRDYPMTAQVGGFWAATLPARPGTDYRFRVDGEAFPDPASRCQAGGVHDASRVTGPDDFPWQTDWRGRDWSGAVLYELHLGTFTGEGTLSAATEKLAELAELGFTAVELMPVGQWAGARGWGYDGVLPFALHPAYGRPDDLRRFVDRAHGLGLMVILDLVMNHFGPEGACLHRIAPAFFDRARHTPWGAAFDFAQAPVREYWIECAEYWLGSFRLDGLRLDAVHQIAGPGAGIFLRRLAQRARAVDPGRAIHLIVEDERNEPTLRETGYDAAWNDDFHHAVHCLLTGESHGYYASFARDPMDDLARALLRGHVEEGQPRPGQPRPGLTRPRGHPCAHLPTTAFVNATQTHDQIGNRARGERLLTLADPQGVRTAYALLLLSPYIPMVFMGEERGATTPFLFFADYKGELAEAVRKGRAAAFSEIAALGASAPDPLAEGSFALSHLDWRDNARARDWLDLTRRALAFRAARVVPLLASGPRLEAQVERRGAAALRAVWRFPAGTLRLGLSMGTPDPDPCPPRGARFDLGRPGIDLFALSVSVEPR
ncbi:malto-oligosyltrehalose trehalohydrolase [Sinirhodobacter populi]|uniref:Malto-oligosyltrehalose trehalohydrolase n=2 Tax=Paenirhodobacter populi TaxID=2306993 RepID=A0A443K277_9RHOB|nr:malto-oligosyltrehalose trehalohydrolase [Sinirhodobacter populi]